MHPATARERRRGGRARCRKPIPRGRIGIETARLLAAVGTVVLDRNAWRGDVTAIKSARPHGLGESRMVLARSDETPSN
jgi:hypothetical protein